MFDAIKRLIDPDHVESEDARVILTWAKSKGYPFKHVKDRSRGSGHVVETKEGWRLEWGTSQRPYIVGKELRFRCDTGVPGDVQLILLSKVLAQTLESEVYSSFTNAMQTQIDGSIPEEMRWLAMHPQMALPPTSVLASRFALFANAEQVVDLWLDPHTIAALEDAAQAWWTDTLVVVLSLNRGMLTLRMGGQPMHMSQITAVGSLFHTLASRMKAIVGQIPSDI